MKNGNAIKSSKKRGWYFPYDDDQAFYVDSYHIFPGFGVVLHNTMVYSHARQEYLECDRWYADFDNTEGKVALYDSLKACNDAHAKEEAKDAEKIDQEKKNVIEQVVELMNKAYYYRGKYETMLNEALDATALKLRIVTKYDLDRKEEMEMAYWILKNRQIHAEFETIGTTSISLDAVKTVARKNHKLMLDTGTNQFFIKEQDNEAKYNALCRIFNL